MIYLKLISDLCAIIEQQNAIIEAQAMELAQHDTVARADEIAALRRRYADAIGECGEVTQT